MTRPSPPQLRVLHAVRVLGFANSAAIAERARVDHAGAVGALQEAGRRDWVHHTTFGDLEGWSLTDAGKAENEHQLARERAAADPGNVIVATHREFLPLNTRLLRACTDWQIRPTGVDQFAPNDHCDAAWDNRILVELSDLSDRLAPLVDRLSAVLARFGGYHTRFTAALRRAKAGEREWVDGSGIDSCHRVWFQLHEDLVATLGIDRGSEAAQEPPPVG